MKPSFLTHYRDSAGVSAPSTRDRIAYLLRAGRSRDICRARKGNVQRIRGGYVIHDSNFIVIREGASR